MLSLIFGCLMQDSSPFGNVFSRDVRGNSCCDLAMIFGLEKEKLPTIQFAICLPFYSLFIFCMQAIVIAHTSHPFNKYVCTCPYNLKVLSNKVDLVENGISRKVFFRGWGAEVFIKIRPPPVLWETFKVTAPPGTITGNEEPSCKCRQEDSLHHRDGKTWWVAAGAYGATSELSNRAESLFRLFNSKIRTLSLNVHCASGDIFQINSQPHCQ